MLTGLEKWETAIGVQVSEDFLQTQVLVHPGFAAAHRQAIEGALEYSKGHAAFQATAGDFGQLFLCGLALYLDATGGLSHRRLRELIGKSGIISAGRASALLWRLRLGKFVEADDVGVGHLKRFVPTRAMEHAFRERMRIEFTAIAALEPAIAPLLSRFDEPAVFKMLIKEVGDGLIGVAVRPEPRLDAYNKVAARTMGVLIVYEMLRSVEDDGAYPHCGLSAASVSGLARRFDVSRSHVLRLLRLMEKAGFLTFDPNTGRAVLQPALCDAMRLAHGIVFTGELRAAHRTLAALQTN